MFTRQIFKDPFLLEFCRSTVELLGSSYCWHISCQHSESIIYFTWLFT